MSGSETSLYESLTTDGGTGIDLGRLATVLTGMIAGSFFGGMASFIITLFQAWVISPITGFANWIAEFTLTFGLGFAGIGTAAWAESIAFTFTLGILAPVFAFGVYLAMSYAIARVREEVSG